MAIKAKNTAANRKILNLPDTPMTDLLFKMDTPAFLSTPKVKRQVIWLGLYKQGAYPKGEKGTQNYYSGATIELADIY